MKRNLWSAIICVIAAALCGCKSGNNKPTLLVEPYNLEQPLEISINGFSYIIEPTDSSDQPRELRVKSEPVDLSDVTITAQPPSQACFVHTDAPADEKLKAIRIQCEDVRRWFDDVTDFALTDTTLCIANGSEVRCWGWPPFSVKYRDLFEADVDSTGSLQANFETPRLLTMTTRALCFLDGEELKCNKYSGIDVETANARMQNVTEMVAFDDGVLCYIDDNGLSCVGDEAKPLVTDVPKNLGRPSGLVGDDNRACVVDAGKPYCWGGLFTDMPAGLEDVQSIAINNFYGCAKVPLGVSCWQPPGLDGPIEWQPELTVAPDLLAFNDVSVCTSDLDGVRCWGNYQVGNAAAELALHHPEKLAFNELGGCAIEDRSLICFGDPIAPQLELPEQ